MNPNQIEIGTTVTLLVGVLCIAHLTWVGIVTFRSKLYLSKATCGIILADIWTQTATLVFSMYAHVMQSNEMPFVFAILLRLSIFLFPVVFAHLLMVKILSLETIIQLKAEKKAKILIEQERQKTIAIQLEIIEQAERVKDQMSESLKRRS